MNQRINRIKIMNVKELIKNLKTLDPELTVCVESDLDGINLILNTEIVKVERNSGNRFGCWSEYYRSKVSKTKVVVLV